MYLVIEKCRLIVKKTTMDKLINATGNWVKFYTVKKRLSLIQTSRNENKIVN